jgi:hypothetical protein
MTSKPAACPAPCSAADQRILDACSTEQWTPASWLAARVWNGPVGKRAGQWQRMGGMLHKLYRLGWVAKHTTEHGQNLWRKHKTPTLRISDRANNPKRYDTTPTMRP